MEFGCWSGGLLDEEDHWILDGGFGPCDSEQFLASVSKFEIAGMINRRLHGEGDMLQAENKVSKSGDWGSKFAPVSCKNILVGERVAVEFLSNHEALEMPSYTPRELGGVQVGDLVRLGALWSSSRTLGNILLPRSSSCLVQNWLPDLFNPIV